MLRALRLTWMPFLLLAMILAACGQTQAPATNGGADTEAGAGGDTGGDTGGGGDLCSILSEGDVGSIAGTDVTETSFTEDGCDFTVGEFSLVNVRYESSFDPNLETARLVCDDEVDVSGVGDQAIWCPGLNVLFFNRGGDSLAVQLVFLDDVERDNQQIAEEIARRIAEGL